MPGPFPGPGRIVVLLAALWPGPAPALGLPQPGCTVQAEPLCPGEPRQVEAIAACLQGRAPAPEAACRPGAIPAETARSAPRSRRPV